MNVRRSFLMILGLMVALPASRSYAAQYSVHDLGTLPGNPAVTAVYPTAISSVGIPTGYAVKTDGTSHAFYDLWSMGELAAPAGFSNAAAHAVSGNNFVGSARVNNNSNSQAVAWWNGSLSASKIPLPLFSLGTWGNGINSSGQVVGSVQYPGPTYQAFVWTQNNGYFFLAQSLLGGASSYANAINDNGTIAGDADTPNWHTHAFLWVNGSVKDLHDNQVFPGGNSFTHSINASNSVVGHGFMANGNPHAFVNYNFFGNRYMIDLGTLGKSQSEANAINSSGTIVGWAGGASNSGDAVAFVSDGVTMKDLNTLIPPNSGWILHEATGINDSGWITGWGSYNGQIRGFLLVP